MTPESAVTQLAAIVAPRPDFTEDEVYAAMADAGIPDPVADRAYKFTQIAWGRILLAGMGIRFAPEFTCFNGAGEVIESGRLADQPYFAAATASARQYVGTPGFKLLALMAAEVHAVNELLLKGSKPENLVTATPVLFMEPPTQAGMERARQRLSQGLSEPKRSRGGGSGNTQGSPNKTLHPTTIKSNGIVESFPWRVNLSVLWQCIDGKLGLRVSTEPRSNRMARRRRPAASGASVNQPHAFDA